MPVPSPLKLLTLAVAASLLAGALLQPASRPRSVGAAAATGAITTVAGTGTFVSGNPSGPATSAGLGRSSDVAVTPDGGYLIADSGGQCVTKVTAAGVISTAAGNCALTGGFAGDGLQATNAAVKMANPNFLAVLPGGGFLVSEELNNCIRKVDGAGKISTAAGKCGTPVGHAGDNGPATSASLGRTEGVIALPAGGFLFSDFDNNCVHKVSADGTMSTAAGICGTFGTAANESFDGVANAEPLSGPTGLTLLPDGGYLIVEYYANRVRHVTPYNSIYTEAGVGPIGALSGLTGSEGADRTLAQLNGPTGVALARGGGTLISDSENNRIRWVTPQGIVKTIAGNGTAGFSGENGPPLSAALSRPVGLSVRPDGSILFADQNNRRIRQIGAADPFTSGLPTLSGLPQPNSSLTCALPVFSNDPEFGYQWLLGGTVIPGETSSYHNVQPKEAGLGLQCRVTATTFSGSQTVTSAPVTIGSYPTKTLTVTVQGQGTVYSDTTESVYVLGGGPLGGGDCPPDCVTPLQPGTELVLYAAAEDGWTFKGWQGPCEAGSDPECYLILNDNTQITATFVPQPTLRLNVLGSGTVSDDLSDFKCGPGPKTCVLRQEWNQPHDFRGSAPGQWLGCQAVGHRTCDMVADKDRTLSVVFGPLQSSSAKPAATKPAAVAATAQGNDLFHFTIKILNFDYADGLVKWSVTTPVAIPSIIPLPVNGPDTDWGSCLDTCVITIGSLRSFQELNAEPNDNSVVLISGCPGKGKSYPNSCVFDDGDMTSNTTITFAFFKAGRLDVFLDPYFGEIACCHATSINGDIEPAIDCAIPSGPPDAPAGCFGTIRFLRVVKLQVFSNLCGKNQKLRVKPVRVTSPVIVDGHFARNIDGTVKKALIPRVQQAISPPIIGCAGGG